MTWDKPNTPAKWLLLFSPPVMCVVAPIAGGLFHPHSDYWMDWSVRGLFLATVSSLGISIWLARHNPSFGEKFGCFLICFVIYLAVNSAVSFAGCMTALKVFPGTF
jgi:hypothetical protein